MVWSILLAQTASPVTSIDWERMLMQHGPLYAMFLVALYFVIWYGPGLINGHKTMLTKVGDASELTASCLVGVEKTQKKQAEALLHVVAAGEELASCPDVRKHLEKAKRVLTPES